MDSIRLKNRITVPIDEGAFLFCVVYRAETEAGAAEFLGELTSTNVSEVDFIHNGVVNGHYEGLSLQYATIDGNTVTFGLEET